MKSMRRLIVSLVTAQNRYETLRPFSKLCQSDFPAQCLICLDDYAPEDNLRVLTCKHAFHQSCVDKWLETGRNNCPACRSKVCDATFPCCALPFMTNTRALRIRAVARQRLRTSLHPLRNNFNFLHRKWTTPPFPLFAFLFHSKPVISQQLQYRDIHSSV